MFPFISQILYLKMSFSSNEHFCEVWSLYLENFEDKQWLMRTHHMLLWLADNLQCQTGAAISELPSSPFGIKWYNSRDLILPDCNQLPTSYWKKVLTQEIFITLAGVTLEGNEKMPRKNHFFTYFLIWLPSICEKRHTVFTKVVDNVPMNISAKFEACMLKTFR